MTSRSSGSAMPSRAAVALAFHAATSARSPATRHAGAIASLADAMSQSAVLFASLIARHRRACQSAGSERPRTP